jgi:hypothetical protein
VKVEGGCATVRGYKFPSSHCLPPQDGKAEIRFETSSQDTGLAVLVAIGLSPIDFSVKEKDEARVPPEAG